MRDEENPAPKLLLELSLLPAESDKKLKRKTKNGRVSNGTTDLHQNTPGPHDILGYTYWWVRVNDPT